MNLRTAATLLPTPTARDGEGHNEGSPEYWENRWATRPDRVGKGIPLGAAATLPPTPTATNQHGNGFNNRGELLLPGIAASLPAQNWAQYAGAVELWEGITGIPAPAPTVPGSNGGVRLNPALPEWMMGLAPGTLTDHMQRNDALRAAGNGCVPQAVAAAWHTLNG